ncbi:MAG: hypothetical protein G8237_11115 [Magnetococcales bacterium]|nr:hypothetical protein [Magnetococcales bacterium]NGZ06893.1 hypothetical protein [Magnetococcales bacterium]
MYIGRAVDWEQVVLASWIRSAGGKLLPKTEMWRPLPTGVCWFECRMEPADIPKCFVIGSRDWRELFGCTHLSTIAANSFQGEDNYSHHSRIHAMKRILASGDFFEPLILTAFSGEGPFVIIDGNHRAIALLQLNLLAGQRLFVGFHPRMGQDFFWFQRSILLPGM